MMVEMMRSLGMLVIWYLLIGLALFWLIVVAESFAAWADGRPLSLLPTVLALRIVLQWPRVLWILCSALWEGVQW